MTEDLLPGLLIALPLIGATLPLAIGLVRERAGWSIAALVLTVETALASWLAYAVYADGRRITHVLGGSGFGRKTTEVGGSSTEGFIVGIELVADSLSAMLVVLVGAVALAVLAFTRRGGPRRNAFYSGYLLLAGGLMGLVLTGDLFNLFVFLEIVGLTTYALVSAGDNADSAVAALKYLTIGTVGASMYLVGVGYIYIRTGTLNMVDVSRVIAGTPGWVEGPLYSDPLIAVAFGFIVVGLATKSAIFPLHTWQPGAYSEAPDGVTIYIAALVSTTSVYAFARITWFVFTPEFFAATMTNQRVLEIVLAVAAISVVAGSALAAMQQRVKRMFAYSSISQFGLIVVAVGLAVHPAGGETVTQFAIYGVVIHLLAHAIIKGGLFAAAGALSAGTSARTVDQYAGLARERPFISGSFAILGFSIVGVPPMVGFIGKWYIGLAAVNAELWPLVFVIFLSTLLTLTYIARIVEKLYFSPVERDQTAPQGTVATDGGSTLSYGMLVLPICAAVLSVTLGFFGAELASQLDPIVQAVLDSTPEVTP